MVPASSHPHEFEKKRGIIISKTLISGDDRFKNSEDEPTMVAEVLKLKGVLDSGEQSEAVLLSALSKLQRMVISVKVLKLTGVRISPKSRVKTCLPDFKKTCEGMERCG